MSNSEVSDRGLSVIRGASNPSDGEPLLERVWTHLVSGGSKTALIWKNGRLSYGQLHERVAAFALEIERLGVVPGEVVAIFVTRDPSELVAILGTTLAGAAYAPVSAAEPCARSKKLLDQLQPRAVVDLSGAIERLSIAVDAPVLSCLPESQAEDRSWKPAPLDDGEHVVSILFTSGSTGSPRGVPIRRSAVGNLTTALETLGIVQNDDTILQFAARTFDGSIMECFGAFSVGATLAVAGEDRLDPAKLVRQLRDFRVTFADVPPTVLQHLDPDDVPRLRRIMSGGERVPDALIERWVAAGRSFTNGYGPTEATVVSTLSIHPDDRDPLSSIGRPIPNVVAAVVDETCNPVPFGERGRLALCGVAVAAGYFRDVEAGGFGDIALPEGLTPGFVTGDEARLAVNQDGRPLIEFLGRTDANVQIRGVRIDPLEVELALCEHPSVAAAAVRPYQARTGAVGLGAQIVVRDGHQLPPALELAAFLSYRLPSNMVPSLFWRIDALEVNTSGKVIRSPLDVGAVKPPVSDLSPENPVLGVVLAALGVATISPDETFVALGGHSLLAFKVAAELEVSYGVSIAPFDLLGHEPLIVACEKVWEGRRPGRTTAAEGPTHTLTPGQERLWLLAQLDRDSAYNIPLAFRLEGNVDAELLGRALELIAREQPALRLRIEEDRGAPVARVDVQPTLRLLVREMRRGESTDALIAAEVVRPFDLRHEHGIRAILFRETDERHVLLIVAHHLIFDEYSTRILISAFPGALARAARAPTDAVVPDEVDWLNAVAAHRERLVGLDSDAHVDFWKSYLRTASPEDTLFERFEESGTRGVSTRVETISTADWTRLAAFGRDVGATPFVTAVTIIASALTETLDRREIVVGVPVANRSLQTEGVIGFFAETMPLRIDFDGANRFVELVDRVRESAAAAFAHQRLPFDLIVRAVNPPRRPGLNPLFETMVAFDDLSTSLVFGSMRATRLFPDSVESKFPLTIVADQLEGGLRIQWELRSDIAGSFADLLSTELSKGVAAALRGD